VTLLTALLACGRDPAGAAQDPSDALVGSESGLPTWVEDPAAFVAAPAPPVETFDALAHDADGDGDLDLLLHGHHVGEVELWLNDGTARFGLVPQASSGLWDNPGLPDLFGDATEVEAAIDDAGVPGLTVWHDLDRHGSWRARYLPDPAASEPFALDLQINAALDTVVGFTGGTQAAQRFAAEAPVATTAFSFSWTSPSVAIEVQIEVTAGGVPVPIAAGPTRTPVGVGTARLWMNDPHGIAWGDVTRGPLPDVFATRGALSGTLVPPDPPKTDGFWADGDALLWARADGVVPPDYGRGRQVAWLDVDGDGVPELHIGCEETPNVLLRWVGDALVDVAPELGLDAFTGDSGTWFDVDGDGDEDLVWLDGNALVLARNDGGVFTDEPGDALGLVFPEGSSDFDPTSTFDDYALVPADADADGDLDVWFAGHGGDGAVALYRNDGGVFTDVTADVGLADFFGGCRLLPADLDLDGRIDVLAIAATVQWLQQQPDGSYVVHRLDEREDGSGEAVVADVDGDGWPDVVRWGGTLGRSLLRATPPEPAVDSWLAPIQPDAAVGGIVRAERASGTITVWRYGSHANTWISQVLRSVPLAARASDPVARVTWTGPDGAERTWENPAGLLGP
jgi:hypothetical protein